MILNIVFPLISNETILWELALPGNVISNPIENKSGEVILICEDRRLYSINNRSGKINWKIKPGGRLENLFLSPDGSIILNDENRLYSIHANGEVRWSIDVELGFQSNIVIGDRSDIFFVSNNILYLVDRFGIKNIIIKDIYTSNISVLNNSLIAFTNKNKLTTISFSGKLAWEHQVHLSSSILQSSENGLYLIYNDGTVDSFSNNGDVINSINIDNRDFTHTSLNLSGDLILYGLNGVSLLNNEKVITKNKDYDFGLYYSDGILIKSFDDWTLKGIDKIQDNSFYPSGLKQKIGNTLSLSGKRVWGDEVKREYYINSILGGDRELQYRTLNYIDDLIGTKDLLDQFPNFYEVLLVAGSTQNKNQDTRSEAYRLIGKSKDINFIPYLFSDLEAESSFEIISYIFYAMGQISVDRSGYVSELINKRIDDYYDEKMVINGLYALYYINMYTNAEYLNSVFLGIEKILNGGYSRNIEKQCYYILEKLK
ncbi:MAG: PQQ-like beta-propeller repeat protein [Spirochaetaceae bacterium]